MWCASYVRKLHIYKEGKDSLVFKIVDIKKIINTVIPHFDKFSLQTKKKADFELFKRIVEIMHRKEHLLSNGLQEIVNLKASLNLGLSGDLKGIFPNTVPVPRPLVESLELPHPQWLAGFASGEGCFAANLNFVFFFISAYKAGVQVLLRFSLTQHSRDEQLLKSLGDYLGCGKVYTRDGADSVEFIVFKLSDLAEKILPFFQEHKIIGIKSKDFHDWCKICELMKAKKHLTTEGLAQIRELIAGMNKGRYIR